MSNQERSHAGFTTNPALTKSQKCDVDSTQGRCAHKWQRTLKRLLDGPLHRFDAERYPVSDHALPSTISELKKRYGLVIHAQLIRLSGYGNLGAHVAEYRLAEESREAAYKLIGMAQ